MDRGREQNPSKSMHIKSILAIQYFNYLINNLFKLIWFQITYTIRNNTRISGKDTIRPNVTLLFQATLYKISMIKLNGISIPSFLTSNLTENEIVTL